MSTPLVFRVNWVDGMVYSAQSITAELVRSWLPERPADGHMGTFGKCYLLCGSTGYTGAPILSSGRRYAAAQGWCSLEYLESIYTIAAVKSDEAMPAPFSRRGWNAFGAGA